MKQFYLILLPFILLYSCSQASPSDKNEKVNNSSENTIEEASSSQNEEENIDVFLLFKNGLLSELQENELSEMNLELSEEEFKYTYVDTDLDGDSDLFVQASFSNSTIAKDIFVIYYNDKESNGVTGFSSDSYHQLGRAESEPSPCDECLFISKEKDVFTFKNRVDDSKFKLKLKTSKYGIKEWQKIGKALSIKEIEAKIATITPKESERIVNDINACSIKNFDGLKKSIFCFDGGTKAQECDIYYSEGKAIVGLVNIEYYNASPANLAAFDESKTNKNEMKLYFKNGNLNSIEKVLDLEGNPIEMKPSLKPYWDILVEAAK